MAIQVEKVYKGSMEQYKMKLVAGKEGLKYIISWVHILENVVVKGYVRGNEFVFTTGIVYQNSEWLLEFVKGLYEYHVSALAINIGPYIQEIPEEVIRFCDDHAFPLFTLPWEVQIIDVTKNYCSQIIEDRQNESNAASIFKDILFDSADIASYQVELSGYGFDIGASYCALIMVLDMDNNMNRNNYLQISRNSIKMLMNWMDVKHIVFNRNGQIVAVLSEISKEQLIQIAEKIHQELSARQYCFHINMGVGKIVNCIYDLTDSYTCAGHSLNLAKKTDESIVFYHRMDIYKILLLIEQTEVLRDLYQETIGTLEKIDQTTNAGYVKLLIDYIEYNGNIKKLAEDMYVHRNTINYKLKQIHKLINCDMKQMEDRFRIMLALKIGKLL